jgi:hypothetical protein
VSMYNRTGKRFVILPKGALQLPKGHSRCCAKRGHIAAEWENVARAGARLLCPAAACSGEPSQTVPDYAKL